MRSYDERQAQPPEHTVGVATSRHRALSNAYERHHAGSRSAGWREIVLSPLL
jgi:hypothetical protein